MKEPTVWITWYLMFISVPLVVLAIFVEDWIQTLVCQKEMRVRK